MSDASERSAPVTLLMAMHCHQPVGNFGFVIEEAYNKSYEPFLGVLERHPGVRLALHYSGCLLDWLLEHRPEFIRRVRALVARGQVEMLASGYYEPILPLLPERDRQGQIRQMREALRARFGAKSGGLWLTERVWEPDLPTTLASAGICYTMVDVNQFAGAKPWLPASLQLEDEGFWDLLGSYTAEHTGSSVRLFPASKRLRYWMPFQPVARTIEYLRRLQGREPVVITFADDGEKFGLWPKTYSWVYEQGWLDQFFSALEREQGWLSTSTFQDAADRRPADGLVYLPCGSYEEMLEWSGGFFRNFFTKYPEANALQQKMLRTSRDVAAMRGAKQEPAARARRELYAGQCNCAYWHGVFGGLYLAHLRRGVYRHLIAAEQLAAKASATIGSVTVADMDGDGQDEVRLSTKSGSLILDPADGGTMTEWNLYGPGLNLLDTLSRRYEPYHEKLKRLAVASAASAGGRAPASIHDTLGVKESGLTAHLLYDTHRRSALVDYALQVMPTLDEVVRSTWTERRLWPAGAFELESHAAPAARQGRASKPALSVSMARALNGGVIRKRVRTTPSGSTLECVYAIEGVSVPVAALEFNLSLRDARYLDRPKALTKVSSWSIAEPDMHVELLLRIDPPATLYQFPVDTVSESEGGLERTYQGLCLVLLWTLDSGASWSGRLQWTAR